MSKSKICIKIIAIPLLIAFLSQDIVFAQGGLAEISVPKNLASSQESYKVPLRNAQGAIRNTIINIQDAHSSLSAQESIVSILDSLVTNYDLNVVSIEGSSGYIDTSLLRTFPDQKARNGAAKDLMARGLMSAAEFFSITSDKHIALYGIEDRAIYKKNVEEFRRVYEMNESVRKDIDGLLYAVKGLKDKIYLPELKALDDSPAPGRGDTAAFKDRWQSIKELAVRTGVDYRLYASLSKLVKSLELEKDIDFDKANRQRELLIGELSERLDRNGLEELVLKSVDFKAGRISTGEFYLFLGELSRGWSVDAAKYRDLTAYTDYIALYESIDLVSIFEEAKEFETAVREKLFANDDQRKLYRLSRYASLIKDLFETKLTNGDFGYLKEDMGFFVSAGEIEDFIKDVSQKYKIRTARYYDLSKILSNIPAALKFYETARTRDSVILENTIKRMKQEGRNVAALVTGGYHTKGLTKLLKDKETSYLVILPKFDPSRSERPYVTILTNRKDKYESVLKSGQYYLATAAYFDNDPLVPEEARLDKYGEDFKAALNAAVAGIEGEAAKKAALEELVARWSGNYREFYASNKYKEARSPDKVDAFLRSLLGSGEKAYPAGGAKGTMPVGAKKVMLVQPGFTWQVNKPTRFPVGLMYLASALRKNSPDVDVSIVDMPAEGIDTRRLLKKIEEEKPDIVAISMVSVFFGIGKEIAREVKAKYPNITIVAGGPHASAMPAETLRRSDFDIAVIGAGEKTFLEIVNAYGDRDRIAGISGIAYKDNAKIVENAPSLKEYDIDELPMATESLDLLRLDRYDDALEGELVYPIMATRGCPYRCAFCGGHAVFAHVRKRSPESVVDEIEYVYRQYGMKLFHFLDDTFTADKPRAKRIFELIIDRNLPIKWMAMTRADALVHAIKGDGDYSQEREFLKLAKDSGCIGFAIGVESGDKDLLMLLDKRLDLEILHKATELTKEAGIHVKYFLMVGIPGQDEASVQKTIDVVNRDRPDSVNVTVLKPLPGSELFELWLAMKMEAKRLGDGYHVFSQYEILKMWEGLRAGVKGGQRLPSQELSANSDMEELMDRLMFEEEPGLKGTFAKDLLGPLFETKEVGADKVIEFRRAIFDAHKKLAKSARKVPVFRRPFSRKKREEILGNVSDLIASEQFEMGRYTLAFEDKFAAKVGRSFALGASNGTDALELALRARFGSLEGKSIIVPANGNIADVAAVIHAGANVVLADVSEDTLNLDPQKLEDLLDNEGRLLNIVGVILVHMGGVISGDIERIVDIAKKRSLFLLEDASHAMGSSRNGVSAGRFGDAAVFSLFSTKVLTSFNGAIIVTDDKRLSAKMRSYRDMGRVAESREELYDTSGGNYKMDEMQAIVAAADLEDLDSRISRRREIARMYDANFQGMEGLKIVKVPGSESNYYKYILTVDPAVYPDFNYNKMKIETARAGIDLPGRIYSYTLDRQIYPEGRLYIPQRGVPVAEQLTDYQIALPIYEDLTDGEARIVINEVNRYISELYGHALKERTTGAISKEKARELPTARESYYHKYARSILMKHLKSQQQKGGSIRFAMKPGDGVSVKAAVRIVFSSCIASDRLPVSIAAGGRVLNMAALINGEKPIGVNVTVLKDNKVKFVRTDYDSSGIKNERVSEARSAAEIGDYSNVDDAFRLAKIFLIASGVIDPQDTRPLSDIMASLGGGLQIETYHNVSQGGGSSNILSIAAFTALDRVIGREESIEDINKSALLAELLTGSIGGWQDHLGVYYPGIKELVALPGEIMPRVKPLKLNETALKRLKDNLVLWDSAVSRDSARAAFKPVLITQTTSSSLMKTLRKRSHAVHERMIDALAAGDTALFGRMLTEKYNLAKLTSPGVMTDYLDDVTEKTKGLIYGASSIGTGGGGYCLLVAKDGCRDKLEELLNTRGSVRKWSVDEKGLEVKVRSSSLESLQGKKFIDEWDEVFDSFKKEAALSPALYETISLAFEGSGGNSLDFSVVIPKGLDDGSSERVLRYISAQIHNRVVTRGATGAFVRSGIEGLTGRLNKYFSEYYDNSRATSRIGDMAGAYFGAGSFTIKDFSEYSPQRAAAAIVPAKSERTAPAKAASVKMVGINFGKMMTKVGIVEIDGKGMFRHLSEPVSFRTWPEGADRSDLKSLIAASVKAVREKISESGLDISAFDGIGVSVSVIVRDSSIVKFKTGLSADFSQDALEQLGEIKRLISYEFPGKEIILENDGNLEALGVARSLGLSDTLTLKFGNTLSAGMTDENGRTSEGINEFTKSVIDISADAYPHNMTGVRGWAGSYISWFGIENNARILGLYEKYDFDNEKEVPQVLRRWLNAGSDEEKKDALQVFERVGRCIAALVRSLEPLYKIDHIVLSGGILAGESGRIITGSANTALSRGKETVSERVRLVDGSETDLRYGYLKGLAYLARDLKGKISDDGAKSFPSGDEKPPAKHAWLVRKIEIFLGSSVGFVLGLIYWYSFKHLHIDPALGAMAASIQPVVSYLLATKFAKSEKTNRATLVAVTMATFGILLFSSAKVMGTGLRAGSFAGLAVSIGTLLILGHYVAFSLQAVYANKVQRKYGVTSTYLTMLGFGMAIIAGVTAQIVAQPSFLLHPVDFVSHIYAPIISCSFLFAIYVFNDVIKWSLQNYSLRHIKASYVQIVLTLVPILVFIFAPVSSMKGLTEMAFIVMAFTGMAMSVGTNMWLAISNSKDKILRSISFYSTIALIGLVLTKSFGPILTVKLATSADDWSIFQLYLSAHTLAFLTSFSFMKFIDYVGSKRASAKEPVKKKIPYGTKSFPFSNDICVRLKLDGDRPVFEEDALISSDSPLKRRLASYEGVTIYDNSRVYVRLGSSQKVKDMADLINIALIDASRIIPKRGPPIAVHVLPRVPSNIQKRIENGNAHILLDENYVNTMLFYRPQYPNAVSWILTERLTHEFSHDNTIGSDEKEAFEERDVILNTDLPFYKILCANAELKDEVDRFFDETGVKFGGRRYFKQLLAHIKEMPYPQARRAVEKFVNTCYNFSFKFHPAMEGVGRIGRLEFAGVEKSYPANGEWAPVAGLYEKMLVNLRTGRIKAGKLYIVGVPRDSVPPLERFAIAREIDRIFNGSAEIYVMESSNPAEFMAEANSRGIKYGAILDIGPGSDIQKAIAHLQTLADKAFREAHADIAIINFSNIDPMTLNDLAAKVSEIELLLPKVAPASIEALKADLERRTRVTSASFAHVNRSAFNALLKNRDKAVSVTTQGVVESGMLYSLRDKIRARWQKMGIDDKKDDPIREVIAITDPRIKNDDAAKRYVSALGLEGYTDYAFARTFEEVRNLSVLYDGIPGRIGCNILA